MGSEQPDARHAVVQAYVRGGGCIRRQNEARLSEGWGRYKKGWEVRLAVESEAEAAHLRRLLEGVAFRVGRPYRKRQRIWIVPIYGQDQVNRFFAWISPEAHPADER